MTTKLLLLLLAGVCSGALNSIAGGGSFITFPALPFVGVAPISANATNTFASCAGYLNGFYALRKDLYACHAYSTETDHPIHGKVGSRSDAMRR
jgi:hypothetical protein